MTISNHSADVAVLGGGPGGYVAARVAAQRGARVVLVEKEREVTCSCGSGVPVTKLEIGGKPVELVALPLIFQKFVGLGRKPDEAGAREVFETVKIYNAVPAEAEDSYREAVGREFAAYCQKEQKP